MDKTKYNQDITGNKYGNLTVVSFAYKKNYRSYWNCLCDCGKTKIAEASELKRGGIKSCGCFKRETAIKTIYKHRHHLTGDRVFNIWRGIKARCLNPNVKAYPNYGGRGIKICDEWKEDAKAFHNWATNNGYTEELTIDRIDHNGDYSPQNCRWIRLEEQQANKRKSIFYYDGNVYYADVLADILGKSKSWIYRHCRSIANG